MAGSLTDTHRLSNGVEIPILGFGTWQTPDGDTARDCVKAALDAGYRHIDTAWVYGNEISVGEGIRASGVNRGDIFLTTKHWVTERGYEKTKAAIDVSLKNLGVDYLDLYLIHWPCVAKISPDWKEINASTWRGFEEAYRAGKIRALGVSNFEPLHLDSESRSKLGARSDAARFSEMYVLRRSRADTASPSHSSASGLLFRAE